MTTVAAVAAVCLTVAAKDPSKLDARAARGAAADSRLLPADSRPLTPPTLPALLVLAPPEPTALRHELPPPRPLLLPNLALMRAAASSRIRVCLAT